MNRDQLKSVIENLGSLSAKGTTLISLYIPKNYQLSLSRQHIVREMSEATNIKSRQTRQNVQRALRTLKSTLDDSRLQKELVRSGLGIFAGNATTAGGSDYFV